MFYTIEALLLSREYSFSKNSAVISAFGKEFVKSGIFDSRFHRFILNAFDLRNAGDYGSMHAVSEEKARQTIEEARELLAAISHSILKPNKIVQPAKSCKAANWSPFLFL